MSERVISHRVCAVISSQVERNVIVTMSTTVLPTDTAEG